MVVVVVCVFFVPAECQLARTSPQNLKTRRFINDWNLSRSPVLESNTGGRRPQLGFFLNPQKSIRAGWRGETLYKPEVAIIFRVLKRDEQRGECVWGGGHGGGVARRALDVCGGVSCNRKRFEMGPRWPSGVTSCVFNDYVFCFLFCFLILYSRNLWIFGFLNFWICGCLDVWISGFLDVWRKYVCCLFLLFCF